MSYPGDFFVYFIIDNEAFCFILFFNQLYAVNVFKIDFQLNSMGLKLKNSL